jgi:hypothetical protein
VLAGLLGEALEAQEASSKRTEDLKQLQPKGMMELFTPEKGSAAAVSAQRAKNNGQKARLQEEEGVPVSPKRANAKEEESQKGVGKGRRLGL